ncbi:MAG: outer membrane protein insertion porin family, partial [Qipengyuania sp.]
MTNFASAATRRNPAARLAIGLLASTMLAGVPTAVLAQEEAASVPAVAPAVQQDVVRTIAVSGAQRLEAQ